MLGIAVLSPLAYILVLTALATTPVSYIAPAREISILVAAILGARLLAEGDGAFTELAARYPSADLAQLRTLIGRARGPHADAARAAQRELFRALRQLLG